MGVVYDQINKSANGGTELMLRGLEKRLPKELLDEFYISRSFIDLAKIPNDKIKIYWTHEIPLSPQVHLIEHNLFTSKKWKDFDKVVFVSNWQMNEYIKQFSLTWENWNNMIVLKNAIEPIEPHSKPTDKIRLIYTSHPDRGLDVLFAAFKKISEKHSDVELEIFSSNNVYGQKEKDAQYADFFNVIKNHKQIVFHDNGGTNAEVREALKRSHIFAYPSTYGETSCISLIEAMSAELLCVHPNQCALFETSGGMTNMYHYEKDFEKHVELFVHKIDKAIQQYKNGNIKHLQTQKQYADYVYSWDNRAKQWEAFLNNLRSNRC